ncbi:hypothetical protein ACFTWH_04355 [Streptomyces sp. NPDC057011]|uniref:hypothetical protein n=1 Tax=unclassified Streptomyces TaxID=2593676 RepID=UPI003639083D
MPRTLKTTRFALLAASTAAAAGAVLSPVGAFAAAPATHAALAADGSAADSVFGGGPSAQQQPKPKPLWAPGQWWKHGRQWQCFAAPCDPPGSAADRGANPATGPGSLGRPPLDAAGGGVVSF